MDEVSKEELKLERRKLTTLNGSTGNNEKKNKIKTLETF